MTPDERRAIVTRLVATSDHYLQPAYMQQLANGPILDPGRIYLPAGKLSEADWRARERRILNGEAA